MSEKLESWAKKTREGNAPLLIWNVPIELKQKFKSKCARKGITMQEGLIQILRKSCKND
jgi:hypothetical protein